MQYCCLNTAASAAARADEPDIGRAGNECSERVERERGRKRERELEKGREGESERKRETRERETERERERAGNL